MNTALQAVCFLFFPRLVFLFTVFFTRLTFLGMHTSARGLFLHPSMLYLVYTYDGGGGGRFCTELRCAILFCCGWLFHNCSTQDGRPNPRAQCASRWITGRTYAL